MESAIYQGTIRHRRLAPRHHQFEYQVFMLYLDLAELDQVFSASRLWSTRRPALAWLRRKDYLPGDADLDSTVRKHVEAETGRRPDGPIRVLTNLRYFGYIINPITVYYCFSADGLSLCTVVLEVTNTPWREKAIYVLPCDPGRQQQRIEFDKSMHVSPFMPMDMTYRWHGNTPGEELKINLENHRNLAKVFDATLVLKRYDIDGHRLRRTLLHYPFMTLKVVAGIYWQAVKIFFGRRSKFYPHTKSTTQENQA